MSDMLRAKFLQHLLRPKGAASPLEDLHHEEDTRNAEIGTDSASTSVTSSPIENFSLPNNRRVITIHHACNLASVSRRTMYDWIAKGKVEYVRTASGSVRVFEDSLWRKPGGNSQAREGS